jgi:hypothetical protein
MRSNVTAEMARMFLRYDAETGRLYCRVRWCRRVREGAEIGCDSRSDKRRRTTFFGENLYVYRLIWLMHYGHWPTAEIDHVDGDPTNNRLCNLREATHAENLQNIHVGPGKKKTSRYMGVHWCATRKKWKASITKGARSISLGTFDLESDAAAAYAKAKAIHHPFGAGRQAGHAVHLHRAADCAPASRQSAVIGK